MAHEFRQQRFQRHAMERIFGGKRGGRHSISETVPRLAAILQRMAFQLVTCVRRRSAYRLSYFSPPMTTYERLRADIITAMKARDTATATALRTMDAAIQRASMDSSKPIDEALTIAAFRKAVKNLIDARTEFEKGGRADLVAVNTAEITILQKYLPAGLDAAKLDALVTEVIATTGATSKKEMGKVIAALKQRPEAGLIDFGAVSKIIQAKLP